MVDEGIGIEPTKLRTLFQRFETLAQQNMLQPSSGIGLSLVKEMVDMHHGTIKVTSEPEAGSRFISNSASSKKKSSNKTVRWNLF